MSQYIIVSELLPAHIGDVSDALQKIIDENPNRVLFFPDGEYLLSKPICTPADPTKSVSLKLSDFAVLRAAEDWSSDEAMIRLGGKDPANIIEIPGSNYGIEGGVIDCRCAATGISIDSGRETYIRNTSIKNAVCGIHIKRGANSGSSDADVTGVNITGTGERGCVGVLVEGWDNTFTNMRIGNVFVGVDIRSAGNMLRNIHPLYYTSSPSYPDYEDSVGFKILDGTGNWFDYCYSDQFATGFEVTRSGGNFVNCFCFWYSGAEKRHVAFASKSPFGGRIDGLRADGRPPVVGENRFYEGPAVTEDAVVQGVYVGDRLWKGI